MAKLKQLEKLAKEHVKAYNDLNNQIHAQLLATPEYKAIINRVFDESWEEPQTAVKIIEPTAKTSSKLPKRLLMLGVVAVALHATGTDAVIAERTKQSYRRFQIWWASLPEDEGGKHEA